MVKKDDYNKLLNEAEYGFEKKNALDFGVKLFNTLNKFRKKYFGKDIEDMKFELNKGYFNELYNAYRQIKNPTTDDLQAFKGALTDRIIEVCNEIETVINKNIDKIRNKLTEDKIEELFKES